MESSFGKDFSIVAKLARSGPSATSRPYKRGGGGGGGGARFSHIPSRACLAVSHPVPEPRSLAVPCLRSNCSACARALSPIAALVHFRALVQPRLAQVPPSPLPPTARPATVVPWPSRDLPCSHPSHQTHLSARAHCRCRCCLCRRLSTLLRLAMPCAETVLPLQHS